jgi:hypothetical protein
MRTAVFYVDIAGLYAHFPPKSQDMRMPRISIYIPDELKEQMDRLEGPVNWSAEAQRAFEHVVTSQNWIHMKDELDRAAARLLSSKISHDESQRELGEKAGRKWTLEQAYYQDLLTLESMKAWKSPQDLWDKLDPLFKSNYFKDEFWGTRNPSQAYAEGFVRGALETFSELKRRMPPSERGE